jgi:hypothetical protein
MKVRKYLIVNARGDSRVVTRRPGGMRFDEVAFPLHVTIPDTWGRVYSDLPVEIEFPDPGEMPSVRTEPPIEEEDADAEG